MTPEHFSKLNKLFKCAELSNEFEFIDLKTVDTFNDLREELGLSKLLLLIIEYAKSESNIDPKVPETQHPHEDAPVVQ